MPSTDEDDVDDVDDDKLKIILANRVVSYPTPTHSISKRTQLKSATFVGLAKYRAVARNKCNET